jgi:hypothetical protein
VHGSHHDEVSPPDAVDAASPSSRACAAINGLTTTHDPAGIERVADELTTAGAKDWTGDTRRELIEGLVLCLAGDSIREDPDAEDALCSMLEQLGVMRRAGNLVFEFTPDRELAPADLPAVRRYRAWLPIKYTAGATAKLAATRTPLGC